MKDEKIQVEIKKLPESTVEITGEIPTEKYESYREEALKHLGKNVEIDGFRKGNVPNNILAQKIPESSILEEMAEIALANIYPTILIDNNIDAIGRPEIAITKMAKGNPLGFVIKTNTMPIVTLPDIKKVAKDSALKEEKLEITDEEVEKAIVEIKKMREHRKLHENDNEGHDHNHEHEELKEENLPELTDEYVKALGNFENIEDFKTKLKQNLLTEKENKTKEKNRIAIIDAIIEKTEVEIPKVFVENELDKMLARLKGDIEGAGMDMEHYMTHIKKTNEDLRKEWNEDAKKRAKLELVIHKISIENKIVPDENEIESETEKLIAYYKDVDKDKARAYVTQMLTNEKVFQFIENSVK